MTDLNKLRAEEAAYLDKLRARGVKLLTYVVPCCGATRESRQGPAEGQWDTLATCSSCGETYMKISTVNAIIALLPDWSRAK